jgi:NTE family protein
MIVSDASAHLTEELGVATGVLTTKYPFFRPPRLFDIATEQTRALRSRMLMDAIVGGRLPGSIIKIGRSVTYIDEQAKRRRGVVANDAFLDFKRWATNASRMTLGNYLNLLRHGFETTDATLTGYQIAEFSKSILWSDLWRWRQTNGRDHTPHSPAGAAGFELPHSASVGTA